MFWDTPNGELQVCQVYSTCKKVRVKVWVEALREVNNGSGSRIQYCGHDITVPIPITTRRMETRTFS